MEVAVLVIVNMTYDNAERSMTPSFPPGTLVFGAGNAGTATQIQALPGTAALGAVDMIKSLTHDNRLILYKNFSLDNELYQLIVENDDTQIINRFYNRTYATNITAITDCLSANNNETFTYNDTGRPASATFAATLYGTRSWTYDQTGNRATEPPIMCRTVIIAPPIATGCRT